MSIKSVVHFPTEYDTEGRALRPGHVSGKKIICKNKGRAEELGIDDLKQKISESESAKKRYEASKSELKKIDPPRKMQTALPPKVRLKTSKNMKSCLTEIKTKDRPSRTKLLDNRKDCFKKELDNQKLIHEQRQHRFLTGENAAKNERDKRYFQSPNVLLKVKGKVSNGQATQRKEDKSKFFGLGYNESPKALSTLKEERKERNLAEIEKYRRQVKWPSLEKKNPIVSNKNASSIRNNVTRSQMIQQRKQESVDRLEEQRRTFEQKQRKKNQRIYNHLITKPIPFWKYKTDSLDVDPTKTHVLKKKGEEANVAGKISGDRPRIRLKPAAKAIEIKHERIHEMPEVLRRPHVRITTVMDEFNRLARTFNPPIEECSAHVPCERFRKSS